MTKKQQSVEVARETLRKMVKPGDTVQTILRHVSRSGMTRRISVIVNGNDVDYLVEQLGVYNRAKNGPGLVVGGCGMDMGFSLVYSLSRRLFPKGFKVDGTGRNGDTSGWDDDGGYALKQRWL